ncbi:hypothetical protein [Nitratireductor sp. CH_MIT9313-5]|uniref:hypothetical protein n=1 Tax=Nitratireductor sp. CH_MIT9313-5 TaxID=3107764 RepID=UPI003009BF83
MTKTLSVTGYIRRAPSDPYAEARERKTRQLQAEVREMKRKARHERALKRLQERLVKELDEELSKQPPSFWQTLGLV